MRKDNDPTPYLEEENIPGDFAPAGHREVDAGAAFGMEELRGTAIRTPVFDERCEYLAAVRENYVFDAPLLRFLLSFLGRPAGDALYLHGPSGCGKTSAVIQTAAVLRWPAVSLTLNGRFELADLIGHPAIVKDRLVFVHGPLARAMKHGYILVLNELDLADAAELSGLNDVLEGRSLVVIQNNGEVIRPHPDFRLIVTANTRGTGNRSSFHGTQLLNAAFLDRFIFVSCGYMPAERETSLLKKAVPGLSGDLVAGMVRVASEIRKSHAEPKPNHVYMSVPMSTRALVRWAELTAEYAYESNPAETAFVHAFAGRLSADERCYALRLRRDVMGDAAD